MQTSDIAVTRETLEKYDKPGPRYTSYPTVPEWDRDFGDAEYRKALANAAERGGEGLSLYVHIPFCRKRCFYCGCNTIVPKEENAVDKYLEYLERELKIVADALNHSRPVELLHWGGGTPTFLSIEQIERLFSSISREFEISPDAHMSLEVDARITTREQIDKLRELGFNRISMGVQDVNQDVQREIGREQSEEETRGLFEMCRDAGFTGINMDLVYGLPGQTPETWTESMKTICVIRPDRLAVYSCAYLPERLKNQQEMDASKMVTGAEKFELFAIARRILLEAGYRAIGMDHFALPEDELSVAMDERRLNRNFMGYTVVPTEEMLGFGASSIGEVGGSYAQNLKSLDAYCGALDEGKLPTATGCFLNKDDEIRRWLIRQMMCNFYLDTAELNKRFGINYKEYFATEEEQLEEFLQNDFLIRDGDNLKVLPLGQVFIRNIAMVFDAYLKKPGQNTQFSRTV